MSYDYGIKIAKPGFDAETTHKKNLLFYSKYPFLKIKQKGSGSITYTNNGAGNDILVAVHNLDYSPLLKFSTQWFDVDSNVKRDTFRPAPFLDSLADGSVQFTARPYIDGFSLRFKVTTSGVSAGTHTLQYFYTIYYDPDEDV